MNYEQIGILSDNRIELNDGIEATVYFTINHHISILPRQVIRSSRGVPALRMKSIETSPSLLFSKPMNFVPRSVNLRRPPMVHRNLVISPRGSSPSTSAFSSDLNNSLREPSLVAIGERSNFSSHEDKGALESSLLCFVTAIVACRIRHVALSIPRASIVCTGCRE